MTPGLLEKIGHCDNCARELDLAWTWWGGSVGLFCSVACYIDRFEVAI